MLGRVVLVLLCLVVAACTNVNDLDKEPTYLGNFHLGHNVVVAPNLTKGPASRDATKEEWTEGMKLAIDERFGRYEGTRLYHLGISVEGYVLAIPGIPLVAAPKSALIIRVTAWDDEKEAKLNEKPETITIVESISGQTLISSGLTQSKETQMKNLTQNAAKLIQNWLVRQNNQEGWFEDDGVPAKNKPQGRAAQAQLEAEEAETAVATDTDDTAVEAEIESDTPGEDDTDVPSEVPAPVL
ncbi:hypothetical protein [Roseovarius rhodophyticola]|uniref:DUF3313 domain-containing protein n=1 Tax=Roseovarius rhodophyticola TaxID=3080827 RepID=A0ABZ2TB68_9RHOB|nr:hypothetical protein [Roseovarius sp. W115]MDV2930648.1 hypothetical protein [Roseovarius sp. W115]